MQTTFIYSLNDPITGEVRYIGKSNNPSRRYRQHFEKKSLSANTHKANWLKSLLSQGIKPSLSVLEECSTDVWEEREQYWIYQHDRSRLTNSTDGGEGISNISYYTRQKMSQAKKGKTPWFLGKHHTEQTKQKISYKAKGRPSKMKGVDFHTQETKEKLRKARIKYTYTITSPEGVEYITYNLRQFCIDFNLCSTSMYDVAKGKYKQALGWTVTRVSNAESKEIN